MNKFNYFKIIYDFFFFFFLQHSTKAIFIFRGNHTLAFSIYLLNACILSAPGSVSLIFFDGGKKLGAPAEANNSNCLLNKCQLLITLQILEVI